ncbi:MAG: hypothetical protein QM767_17145 [Anaeromyxobacter sp.]
MRPRRPWRPGAALTAAALAAALACSAGKPFRCPARGGPPWQQLVSDHFVLRTDLPADRAGEMMGDLERLRAAIRGALFADAPQPPGRIEVIAFRSDAEFAPFAPEGNAGYYFRYAGGPPRIVLSGAIRSWQRILLAHELTHHFLAGAFVRRPAWFAEGLAVYMESISPGRPGEPVVVGEPPPARIDRARKSGVGVRQLLAWDGGPRPDALDYYARSWLLVHYLVHERGQDFAALQARLAAGAPPAEAWSQTFPEYAPEAGTGPEALDQLLKRYAFGPLERTRKPIEVPIAIGYQARPEPPAEVHALRLALWPYGPRKPAAQLRAEVEEMLREDADHPLALQMLAQLDGTDPLPLARRAVEAHPEDPRAWTFLGHSLILPGSGEARVDAYRKAVDLAPENPAALYNLAQELLEQGRSGEGLPPARRAAQLAPWSPPLLAGFAAVLSDLGQCDAAIPIQQRALEALPERGGVEARGELLRGLDRYERQCSHPAMAPGTP